MWCKNANITRSFLAAQVPRKRQVHEDNCFLEDLLESQQFEVVCRIYDKTSTNVFQVGPLPTASCILLQILSGSNITATCSTDIRAQHPDTANSQETDLKTRAYQEMPLPWTIEYRVRSTVDHQEKHCFLARSTVPVVVVNVL